MTKPGDPQKGKAAAEEQAEQQAKDATEATAVESAEAAATEDKPKPKPKRAAKKKAEPAKAETAAETTEVDKEGAEAAAVAEPKPKAKRAPAKKKKPEEKAAADKPAKPAAAPQRRRSRDTGEQVVVRAQARYVRSSARKARLVCDHIRGKSVAEARAILAFSPRQVSEAWTKLLESAVANAENNHDLVGEDLKVHAVYADEGPTIKRYQPRAMGRATRIRKRTSHLSIQLTPRD